MSTQASSSGVEPEENKLRAVKHNQDDIYIGSQELNELSSKGEKISAPPAYTQKENRGFFGSFIDGFKPFQLENLDPDLTDIERANIIAARAPLKRSLKARHIQMIAIGGAIGTGLFVGSGKALAAGGPASLVICYFLIGTMIFCMVQSLGELAIAFPVAGGFLSLISRFVSPTWGFLMAWNYAFQWLIVMPLELVAAAMTINYWNDTINSSAWVGIFYSVIVFINIFGVKGYGEAEFIFSLVKVIAVIGFIILGIVLTCGGGPQGGYIGGRYWHNPGAFNHGFKGLCSVFVTASFSFAGTELVGLASAETENPRKALPSATKQVFWRITLFYMITLILIGCLVPYNDSRLFVSGSANAAASPFVIAIKNAGISGLPSVMNAVILIAVLSVANSAVFACSRTLASLADQSFAPQFFGYIDRKGRPLVGVMISLIIGLLCFLAGSDRQAEAFSWMLAITGLSCIFNWGSICFAHIRFRHAMKAQGRGLDELSFTAISGYWGSVWGVLLNCLILVAQFWVSLFPVKKAPDPEIFFENYLNVPFLIFFLVVWICMHWYKKEKIIWFIKASDIDVDTGRRVDDLDVLRQEIAEERACLASKPFYYRIYKFWC